MIRVPADASVSFLVHSASKQKKSKKTRNFPLVDKSGVSMFSMPPTKKIKAAKTAKGCKKYGGKCRAVDMS